MSDKVECQQCGREIDAAGAAPGQVSSCPGSESGRRTIEIHDDAEGFRVRDCLRIQAIDKSLPKKKNPRVDIFTGAEQRKRDGKFVDKERVIDKTKNLYREKVIDPDTGEIIHSCEEKLTEHQGHGSAKRQSCDGRTS